MPVAQYVGGVEHAILHLLYSRFFTKVLHDMGMVDFIEPFTALLNQGSVINQGKAMSKSLGNGVDLGVELAQFGVDAVRLTMLFAGPPEDDIDWADMSPGTHAKFLAEVVARRAARAPRARTASCRPRWPARSRTSVDDSTRLGEVVPLQRRDQPAARADHGAAARRCDEGRTGARRAGNAGDSAGALRAVHRRGVLVAAGSRRRRRATAFTPSSGRRPTRRCWSKTTVTCVVQVAGKVRDRLEVPPSIGEEELQALALASEAVQRALDGRPVHKVIVRAPKLVNIVPG